MKHIKHWIFLLCIVLTQVIVAAPITLPTYQETQLDSGLRIISVENHEQEGVFIQLYFPFGESEDLIEKRGLTSLFSRLFDQGTAEHSQIEIAERFDQLGASFGVSLEKEYWKIQIHVISQNWEKALGLLEELLTTNTFPTSDLEREKKRLLAGIQQSLSNPGTVCRYHVRALLYKNNPLGTLPSKLSIAAITQEDLLALYENWIRPDHATLFISGDIDSQTVDSKIEDLLSEWESTPTPMASPLTLTAPTRNRLIEYPEATQSFIRLVKYGLTQNDPNYPAYKLLNYVLGGGGFSSRLMTAVRSEGGKTYGINSGYELHAHYGIFGIMTFTRTPETKATLILIQDTLKKVQEEGITAEELQAAKDYFNGAIPLSLETPLDYQNYLVGQLALEAPFNQLPNLLEAMNTVTLDQVNALAKTFLDWNTFTLVLVTHPDAQKDLTPFGPFEVKAYPGL